MHVGVPEGLAWWRRTARRGARALRSRQATLEHRGRGRGVRPIGWDRHGRPFSKRLLDEALSLCRELSETQPEAVLCHQDAHGGNILSAGERWLAIDPKPLIGERAFDLASALRDRRPMLMRSPDPARVLARRLDQFVAELGVDRERARGWGIVHALAWGVSDDTVYEDLVRCAGWLQAI